MKAVYIVQNCICTKSVVSIQHENKNQRTVLARLLKTGQKVDLSVEIVWPFSQSNFIPALSCSPSASFTVFHDLLLRIQHLEMSRNTFHAVWLIYLRIDRLKVLQQIVLLEDLICVGLQLLLLAIVLLPVEESTSVRATLNCTLRDHLGRDELKDALHTADLFDRIHFVFFRNASPRLTGHNSGICDGLLLLL